MVGPAGQRAGGARAPGQRGQPGRPGRLPWRRTAAYPCLQQHRSSAAVGYVLTAAEAASCTCQVISPGEQDAGCVAEIGRWIR